MTAQEIAEAVAKYVNEHGGLYNGWYAGITGNIERRLFVDHGVSRNGEWIYAPANTSVTARSVEAYLHKLGCDGDTGGGDHSATVVYVYKKVLGTRS